MSARKDNGYDYPEDEFDRIAAENEGPAGTHREVRSKWSRFVPYLIVLIIAPTLAYLLVAFIAGDFGGEPKVSATDITNQLNPSAETESEEPPTDESETDGGLAGEDPTQPEETTPEATINYDASIKVLNGAGVQGIAKTASEKLAAANFTKTEATNYPDSKKTPTVSTVFYASADQADTAAAVASALGITAVELDTTQGDSITVVIRKDFKG